MRTWEHSGFSVDQSVFLPAGDQAGIERLIQYMTRCPFSLSRLVKVSDTGQVIYQSEKQACLAFPDPKGDGMQAGVPRNFQILEPLDFLAEFTQHIPPKGSHLIRYYNRHPTPFSLVLSRVRRPRPPLHTRTTGMRGASWVDCRKSKFPSVSSHWNATGRTASQFGRNIHKPSVES